MLLTKNELISILENSHVLAPENVAELIIISEKEKQLNTDENINKLKLTTMGEIGKYYFDGVCHWTFVFEKNKSLQVYLSTNDCSISIQSNVIDKDDKEIKREEFEEICLEVQNKIRFVINQTLKYL